jgi:hypothetical protein
MSSLSLFLKKRCFLISYPVLVFLFYHESFHRFLQFQIFLDICFNLSSMVSGVLFKVLNVLLHLLDLLFYDLWHSRQPKILALHVEFNGLL